MKIFRYIIFFLSVLVISGHDVVPHFHDDDHDSVAHSDIIPISSTNSFVDLQSIFSHFQHNVNGGNLVYLTVAKKQINFQKKSFSQTNFFVAPENPIVWYANYKKQRFKDYLTNPPNYELNAAPLRGPPTC